MTGYLIAGVDCYSDSLSLGLDKLFLLFLLTILVSVDYYSCKCHLFLIVAHYSTYIAIIIILYLNISAYQHPLHLHISRIIMIPIH